MRFSAPSQHSRAVTMSLLLCAALLLPACATSAIRQATPTPGPGKVLRIYSGHTSRVVAVAWSPDGKRVASASLDGTAQVWDSVSGTTLETFRSESGAMTSVAWSPTGDLLATGDETGLVRVWEVASQRQALSLVAQHGKVDSIAWSPDGHVLATGGADAVARVWDARSGALVAAFTGHTGEVHQVAWSPDGRRVASASSDATVRLWDPQTGAQSLAFHEHTDKVFSVAWSPDGHHIASGSLDKTVRVWDSTTGSVLYTYSGYNVSEAAHDPTKGVLPDQIFTVAWSHSGQRIAAVTQVYCGDECGMVVTWDALTGQDVVFYVDQSIFALAWSPDDTRFAAGAGPASAKVSAAR